MAGKGFYKLPFVLKKNLSGYIQRWHILEMNTQYLICEEISIWMLLIII